MGGDDISGKALLKVSGGREGRVWRMIVVKNIEEEAIIDNNGIGSR